jgi:hypothetical protein
MTKVTRLHEFSPFGRLVSMGSFLNNKSNPNFGPILSTEKVTYKIGYILGDFFTNSSGHPHHDPYAPKRIPLDHRAFNYTYPHKICSKRRGGLVKW